MSKVIALNFSGTLIMKDVAKEASKRRFHMLGKEVDEEWLEHALTTTENEDVVSDLVSKYTGRKDGSELKAMGSTFLKYHLLGIAHERKSKIFHEGIIKVLEDLKKKKYVIALFSGMRTDTVEGMLELAEKRSVFDFVLGQPPKLGITNEELLKSLPEDHTIMFVIGDKINDIHAGKSVGAKTIFCDWGHATGEEEKKADFVVKNPGEIFQIIEEFGE